MKTKKKELEKKNAKKDPVIIRYLSKFLNEFKLKYSYTDLTFEEKLQIFVSEFSKYCGDDSEEFKNYLSLIIETDPMLTNKLRELI